MVGPSLKLTKPKSPSYSMASRVKDTVGRSEGKSVPGPGKYVVQDGVGSRSPNRSSPPRFSFGGGDRFGRGIFVDSYAPGPGTYNLKTCMGRSGEQKTVFTAAPATSMSSRTVILRDMADTMGPGVCREDSFTRPWSSPNMKRSPSFTMSGRPKGSSRGGNGPGPGEYEVRVKAVSTIKSAPAVSLSGRVVIKSSSESSFSVRTDSFVDRGKGITMGSRLDVRDKSKDVPGPGEYGQIKYETNIRSNSKIRSSSGFKFSSNARQGLTEKGRVKTPGPGSYSSRDAFSNQVDSMKKNRKACPFGPASGPTRRKKAQIAQDYSPGPGTYNPKGGLGRSADSRLRSAPSPTLGSREKFGSLSSLQQNLGPGPAGFSPSQNGIQQLVTQRAAPRVHFGSGQRSKSYSTFTPGPGQYENVGRAARSTQPSQPRFTFGQRVGKESKTDGSAAGPGVPRSDAAVGKQVVSNRKSASSFTFGSRLPSRDGNNNPGPGAYG